MRNSMRRFGRAALRLVMVRWLVVLIIALQPVVGAIPVFAQGSSHAVAIANDARKRMSLLLVGDAVGVNTVQLQLTATPAIDAPTLQVAWDVANAQMVGAPLMETLAGATANSSALQTRSVVLPGQGIYPLLVSVTYQPEPGRQFGASTMLFALVDAQGSVTLTARDPNVRHPSDSPLVGEMTKVSSDATVAGVDATQDDPCFSVSGTVRRWELTNTQSGRAAPVQVPVRNAYVEMREEDIVFDDSYGETRTDANGNYSFSFCDDDGVFDDDLEIYVRLRAELFSGDFSVVEVTDSSYIDETYEWDSRIEESDGGTFTFPFDLSIEQSEVFNIADAVLDAWLFWNASGGAQDDDDTFDDQAEVHWEPGYGDSISYYNGDADWNEITIADAPADADQWDDSVIMHEWGHQADDNYGCDDNAGGPHNYGQILSDPELAWGEAYPDYWQSAVRSALGVTDGSFYIDANNAGANMISFNLEANPTSANAAVEDAIATMLWDLADSVTDGQDTMGVGHAVLQEVYTDPVFASNGDVFDDTCTVGVYLQSWKELGKPTDAATAASITQNIGLATPFGALASTAEIAALDAQVMQIAGVQATTTADVAGDDYVWWQRVTMIADNSASMAGPKFEAVKTVMKEQVNDLQDLPQGVEFGLYNFNNTQAGSQEVVRGRFFPEFILPAIDGMGTTPVGIEPCSVNAFDALAASVQDKRNGEAWVYTDGDTTLGPGVESMQQLLTTRGLHGSFVMLGGCSSPPDAQPDTLGAAYNFLGKAANGTQSSGIVPYLLTAIATGGNFLFVNESQLADAGDILRAQLSHSAGAGRWADYVSTGPTYSWDRLTSWEYNWVTPDLADGVGQAFGNTPLEIAVPSVKVYNVPYEVLRVYGDGYILMGSIPGGPIQIGTVNRILNILNASLYWEPTPPAATASASTTPDAIQGNYQGIYASDTGEWVVITTQSENGTSQYNRAYQALLNKNTGEIRYQYKTIPAGDAGNAVIGTKAVNIFTNATTEVVVSDMDDAGANPGTGYKFTPMPPQPTKTFTVPVDAQMGGVGFLLTGFSGTLAPLAVTAPDGTPVDCDAEGTLCLNLDNGVTGLVQYVQTNVNGRNGDWHAVVTPGGSGEGTFAFTAMGASAIKVSSPSDHQLPLGLTSTLAIKLGGVTANNQLTAWFQRPDGSPLGSQFTLFDDGTNGDDVAGDGEFGWDGFAPPGGGVGYLWVRGVVNGSDLQRSDPTPYNFQPLSVTGPTDVAYLGVGEARIDYTITNLGDETYCYDHFEQLPAGWTAQWEFTLSEAFNGFCLAPSESKTRTLKVTPLSLQDPAPSGSFGDLVVTFQENERGQIVDSAATTVARYGEPTRVAIENHYSSSYVRPNETDTISMTVGVFDAQGFPVVDGTVVDMSTTLGTITPLNGGTVNGQLPIYFTAGNTPGDALIEARVVGITDPATTTVKIQDAVADSIRFQVTPTDLRQGTAASMIATVLDQWGNPVANATVRVGVEDDGESGTVAAVVANQVESSAVVQASDVVTLTTDAQGQVSATFTKAATAVGRVGVRAEYLFDEGDGMAVRLEERRTIILSDSGLFTRDIFLPNIRDDQ